MNSKLVLFGGTGGLGTSITPLLEKDFIVLKVGRTTLNIADARMVRQYFEKEGYIPNIVYMSVYNHDSMLHKLEGGKITSQIEVNIRGFLSVLREGLPLMRENNYGRVIYVSSILSEKPIVGTGIYSATKAFNDNIVRTCALENAKYNITCNSLQLGYFNTGLSTKVPQSIMAQVLEKTPAKRLGNAEDLNKAIRFILESPFLTGINIPLSGGLNLV